MSKKKPEPKNSTLASKYLTILLSDGTKKKLRFRGKTEADAIAKRDKARLEYEMGLLVVNDKTPFSDKGIISSL